MKYKRLRKSGEKRSRLGCNTCKRRRVKCDERHPNCLRCEKLGLECEYQIKLLWHDEALDRGISFGRSKQFQLIKSQRIGESRDLPKELTLSELSEFNTFWTTTLYNDVLFINANVKDFEFPNRIRFQSISSPLAIYDCIEDSTGSPYLDFGIINSVDSHDTTIDCFQISNILPTVPLNFNFDSTTHSKELQAYEYMITKVFPNCICYEGNFEAKHNPYLNYLVPLSVNSDILFKSLLSYSALIVSIFNHEYTSIAIKYENEVLHELPELIKLKQCINLNDWEDIFGTILILCSANITSNCDFQWIGHSEGGKKLLNRVNMSHSNPFNRFFIRYIVSHEVLRNTIQPNEESNALIHKYIENDTANEIDLMLGCSPNLLKFINDITILADSYETLEFESLPNKVILQDSILFKTSSLLNELDNLHQLLHIVNGPQSFEINLIAQIKQMSAQLYLYARINLFYCKINVATKATYDNVCHEINTMIISIIEKIQLLKCTTMTITWPLFLIGILGANLTEDHRWYIMKKFKDMEALRGLANIRLARTSVELVWKYRDLNESDLLTWKDLMNFNTGTLSLA